MEKAKTGCDLDLVGMLRIAHEQGARQAEARAVEAERVASELASALAVERTGAEVRDRRIAELEALVGGLRIERDRLEEETVRLGGANWGLQEKVLRQAKAITMLQSPRGSY